MCERDQSVASRTPPDGDLAHNPGLCPDWESNQRPFGSQAGTPSTEPHHPGRKLCFQWQSSPGLSALTYLNNNKSYILKHLPVPGERRKLRIKPRATRKELTSLSLRSGGEDDLGRPQVLNPGKGPPVSLICGCLPRRRPPSLAQASVASPGGSQEAHGWRSRLFTLKAVCPGRMSRDGKPPATAEPSLREPWASGANCSLLISVTIKGNLKGKEKEDTVPKD